MKKLLSVLAGIGIASSSATSVVACGTKKEDKSSTKPEQPKKDITQIVQNFEQDVTKIWNEHYEKEVAVNLIGVESMEEDNEFLNKHNIQKFSKPENKNKLTVENKKQLNNDVEKLFKVKLLEEKLNELKKVNKYKIILDEVTSVFEHVELIFDNDNFKINSGELSPGVYIGNVIVDYKVVTNYKGLADIEKFKQSGRLKYTSTDSKSFKTIGDEMYKNIAKDIFASTETQKYVNLKWSEIKESSKEIDAYLDSNAKLKKSYNENNEFHNAMLKTIKTNYFKGDFSSLDINYEKKSIYKTDDFVKQNKDYLIISNFMGSLDLKNVEDQKDISKILQGDKKTTELFLYRYFSNKNMSNIRENYRKKQDEFLNKFLTKVEVDNYKKTNSYKFAIAMGYADFIGPVIKIGKGESTYSHELPDFKLAISYSMNGNDEQQFPQTFVEFGIKAFEIYKQVYKPDSESIKELKDKYDYDFLFDLKFDNDIFIKDQYNFVQPKTNSEINNSLKKFDNVYYTRIKEQLSSIGEYEKILNNKDILFEMKTTNEILSKSQSNYIRFESKQSQKIGYFQMNNYQINKGDKIFKEFEYIQINLFGVIKIKIYFDKDYRYSKSMTIF
ncbi:lipoprotein [Spiroplasma floricola]|uniref:Lipoprotein n=1 Tax=Spiroplasma floricola 23-6 TaxID=1336749 RepID=A0A2K8SDV3_9MOLU|nr:lipoprotein [Spiroplasma floricola]AUB31636.1 hypothetical protein SFLOR_v1c05840 [Spiroplasma floricola 23-6]